MEREIMWEKVKGRENQYVQNILGRVNEQRLDKYLEN